MALAFEPMMNTGVVPPLGTDHSVNPISKGAASVTPWTDKARVRSCSSNKDGSSKHFVPSGAIQRSAGAWSIIVVTMRSKLK